MELFIPKNPLEAKSRDFSAAESLLPEKWVGSAAAPLEIDIGCHKGTFLVAMAQRYPARNFLGIERQSSRVEKCLSKIRRLGLSNAHVARAEALPAVRDLLPAACADVLHVLFPDPWPKRRHHIRRLIQEDFLSACARVLKPTGLLRVITDDPTYAAAIRELATEIESFNICNQEDINDYPQTEFQKRFQAIGRPFYGLALWLSKPSRVRTKHTEVTEMEINQITEDRSFR